MNKKFILNADDFGISKANNRGTFESYSEGILKSASLVANGDFFEDAINNIIPQCPELGIGIHLNLTEGKSICEDLNLLTDNNSYFKNNFWQLLLKIYFAKNNDLIAEIEREFRCQIEKIMAKTKVTHIDSHHHIHSIPIIFDLVCRLAKEYGIKQVRTLFEKPYIVPDLYKHFNFIYPLNFFNAILLGFFSIYNESTINKYELKTNDYSIGLIYHSLIDSLVISYGAKTIKYKEITVEAIIHPKRYEDGKIDNYFKEFLLTKNIKLKKRLEDLGYEITNYIEKES